MGQTLKPTPEQKAVLDSSKPARLTIANAGTGKTFLMAMAYCQTYLEEEKNFIAHNPLAAKDEQGHLTDLKDIAWLTKLFDPITFTRRAAEELLPLPGRVPVGRCKRGSGQA